MLTGVGGHTVDTSESANGALRAVAVSSYVRLSVPHPTLLATLALIETPMDFRGLSLGGSICEFGAAGEHSRMIWVCFDSEADPHHRIPERAIFGGRVRAPAFAAAGAVPIVIALDVAG